MPLTPRGVIEINGQRELLLEKDNRICYDDSEAEMPR